MSLCCARLTCGLKYLFVEKNEEKGSGQALIDLLHLQRDSTASRPNHKKRKKFYIRQGRLRRKSVVNESAYIALAPALSHGYVILSITTIYVCSSE